MDAKSKANFINSVAGGQKIPCPQCNSLNDADSMFCMTCGTKLVVEEPAEEPVEEAPAVVICPECGNENEAGSMFCSSCGHKLVVEEPAVEEPVAEEPVAEEPVAEEPVAEELVVEEPVVDEAPAAEEPAVAEEPAFNPAPAFAPVKRPSAGNQTAAPKDEPAFAPAADPVPVAAAVAAPVVAAVAAAPVKEETRAFKPINIAPPIVEPEEVSVFAQGLPDWDIVPPQIMVRRKRKA